MLEGPPAEDMMYANDLIGLSPSKYGGGGSESSVELWSFVSRGRTAFTAAAAAAAEDEED